MDLESVRVISQWAGAIAVLALLACFISAALALQFSRVVLAPAGGAFQLARHMALLGGGAVTTAGVTSTVYWWWLGVASTLAAITTVTALGLAGLAFAGIAWRLCRRAAQP